MAADTKLYDTLGVRPGASSDEIRKVIKDQVGFDTTVLK